jgi:hypothetical protein
VDRTPRAAGERMTGPGETPRLSPEAVSIVLDALYRLAQLDGLTTREIAVRCILTGTIPTTPAFSREVVTVYQKLEQDLTRGPALEVNA